MKFKTKEELIRFLKGNDMKGCLKELKRLKKVYKEDYRSNGCEYDAGVMFGLTMAISVIKNKEFYGD